MEASRRALGTPYDGYQLYKSSRSLHKIIITTNTPEVGLLVFQANALRVARASLSLHRDGLRVLRRLMVRMLKERRSMRRPAGLGEDGVGGLRIL